MSDCPFCKMISGELESIFVHQDPICSALMSFQPINPGHLMVIPNQHIQDLEDLPEETAAHLFLTGQQLGRALRNSGIQCEGINIFLTAGRASESKIPHLHLHVIPRFEGDGFEFLFSPRYAEIPILDELEKNAYHIKAALEMMTSHERMREDREQ